MNGLVQVGLVIGGAAVIVVAIASMIVWLGDWSLGDLPELNVDAEEELEHLRRRERLHVVPQSAPEEVRNGSVPFDWRKEGGL